MVSTPLFAHLSSITKSKASNPYFVLLSIVNIIVIAINKAINIEKRV